MEIIGTILSPSTTCCGEHWDNSFSFNVILVGILKRFCPLLRHAGRENCATYFLWHASGKHWDDLSPSMISWWRTFGRSFVGHDGGEHVYNRYSFYDRLLERIGGGGDPFSFYYMLVGNIGAIFSPATSWWGTLRRFILLLRHAGGEHWGGYFSFYNMLMGNIGSILYLSTTCCCSALGGSFLVLRHASGEYWDDIFSKRIFQNLLHQHVVEGDRIFPMFPTSMS